MIITLYDNIMGLSYYFIITIFYTIPILMFYDDITLYFHREYMADVCLVVTTTEPTFGNLFIALFLQYKLSKNISIK